jgi:glycosyltransferase involved in cell wall biosynthesis
MRIGIDASRAFERQRTGTENYSYQIIKTLLALPEADKHDWVIYVREGGKDFDIQNKRIDIVRVGLPRLWTQAGLAARTWIDKLDVLWVPAHTLPILRKPGMKTVVTIHGIEYEWLPAYENRLQRWYLPLSTRYAAATATRVIAVSQFTKRQLIERLGVQADKICVIYEGAEIEPVKAEAAKVLSQWNLKKGEYLLFVGTVQPRKNLARLIEAVARMKKPVKLVIAGKLGWNFNDVLEAPLRFGIPQEVEIVGYINDTERNSLLLNSAGLVLPSITEGFGLPIVEAMAAGVPVAASTGGALPEVVGEAGLLFDPEDVVDICQKLTILIEDKNLRRQMVEKGICRAKEFRWEKAAQHTLKVLEGVQERV